MAYTANPMYTSTANMNSSYRGLASYTAAYTAQAESNNSVRSNGYNPYNPYNTYGVYSNPNADYSRSAYEASSVRTLQSGRGIRPAGYSNGFGQVRSTSFSSVAPMSFASPFAKDLRSQSINSDSYNPASSSGHSGPRRSAEQPVPTDPPTNNPLNPRFWIWYTSEGGQDWVRINGSPWGIIADPDDNWPSYVDPDYWEDFFENYPDYKDDVEEWFNNHPDAPNNPFVPVGDTPWMIMALLALLYIAYTAYKRRKEAKA